MVAFEVENGVMYMAVSTRPRASKRERAERLAAEGKCVKCERPIPPKSESRMGRCDRCNYKRRTKKLSLPADKRPLYDAKLIKAGTLLESSQGRRREFGDDDE